MDTTYNGKIESSAAAWGAVFSMSLCVAVLIASEFLPVSLLSPIAADLRISEGLTGQAISISGIFAVLTSLFVASATRGFDRRLVITGFTALLILSGAIVTLAPNYAVLMLGRVFLGIAIGGFWSMSTAVIMRLVPPDAIPRGLAMINAGNAISATISAPLGSLLGDYLGWRGAFFFVIPLAVLALAWQWISLPSLPPRQSEGSPNVFRLLARRPVALAMSATGLLFMGQFALFTYLRPFLETVTSVSVPTLSLLLLLMGLASVAGTYLASQMLRARLFSIVVAIPLVMGVVALGLIALGQSLIPAALLLIAWGLFNPAAGMGWGAWLARCLPDDAEAGGGLQVATIQLAITAGAAGGGVLFDTLGWWSPFALSAALLCGSSLLAVAAWRSHPET